MSKKKPDMQKVHGIMCATASGRMRRYLTGDAANRPASMGLRATLHRRDPWTWGSVEHASYDPKRECAKCSDRTWKLYRSRAEAFADHELREPARLLIGDHACGFAPRSEARYA